jgi:hypothetical protein
MGLVVISGISSFLSEIGGSLIGQTGGEFQCLSKLHLWPLPNPHHADPLNGLRVAQAYCSPHLS